MIKNEGISPQDICAQFNLTYHTVNHYTNLGLLKVVIKRRNRRLYDAREVRERLSKIEGLALQGYPLQLISKTLNEAQAKHELL
ncbi:MAG: MerR family transcriptional regulator [Candidatus Omnitrophota bacterium]